jgi:hypothetical protein
MERKSTYAYVVLTGMVGMVFWIALAASVDMDYAVERVTFTDATAKAVHMPVTRVLRDNYARDYLWFLVSVVLTLGTVLMPRASFRIVAVFIAVLASLPAGGLVAALLAPAFPLYLFTGSDGETWGEAWPAMSAVGFWVVVSVTYAVVQWTYLRRKEERRPQQRPA